MRDACSRQGVSRSSFKNSFVCCVLLRVFSAVLFFGNFWLLFLSSGYDWISHPGGGAGYSTAVSIFPALKLGIFCSHTVPFFDFKQQCDYVAFRVADMAIGLETSVWDKESLKCSGGMNTTPEQGECVQNSTLKQYEGSFKHPLLGYLNFTYDETSESMLCRLGLYGKGRVCVADASLDKVAIMVEGAFAKFPGWAGSEVRFLRDGSGVVNGVEATSFSPEAPPIYWMAGKETAETKTDVVFIVSVLICSLLAVLVFRLSQTE